MSPAAAVGGDVAAPAPCPRRRGEARRARAAGLNEGPDTVTQLLPVSGVTTGLFQVASAFSLVLSEVSASRRPPALSGGPGGSGGVTSVCHLGGTFQALCCERVVLWGVTPTPTLRQRLRGNTALAQICISFFLNEESYGTAMDTP